MLGVLALLVLAEQFGVVPEREVDVLERLRDVAATAPRSRPWTPAETSMLLESPSWLITFGVGHDPDVGHVAHATRPPPGVSMREVEDGGHAVTRLGVLHTCTS